MKSLFLKYKPQLTFFFVFTLGFFLVKILFVYLLPFIIGVVVSLLMYPIYRFMKKRLSFKPAFSATVITLFIFSVVLAAFGFLLYLLITESINLYYNNDFIKSLLNSIEIDAFFTDLNLSGEMFSKISDTAFGIVKIIPVSITLIIISFVSTICIINNLPQIRYFIESKLSKRYTEQFSMLVSKSRFMFKRFVRSYILLYTITFVESVFIFSLIDLDYVIVFAFLTAISDVLPILGPGTVYFPIAVICALKGDYLSSITLVIFWMITIVIRQIIEPKILSDTIKIHPLIILSALYFSIVSSNIWVLFYIILFTIIYKIFIESNIFEPVFFYRDKDNSKEC